MKTYEIVVYELKKGKKHKRNKRVISILVDDYGIGILDDGLIPKMSQKKLENLGAGAEILKAEFYGRLDEPEPQAITVVGTTETRH